MTDEVTIYGYDVPDAHNYLKSPLVSASKVWMGNPGVATDAVTENDEEEQYVEFQRLTAAAFAVNFEAKLNGAAANSMALVAGQAYTASVWIRTSVAMNATLQIRKGTDTTQVAGTTPVATGNLTTDLWTFVSFDFTPTETVGARLVLIVPAEADLTQTVDVKWPAVMDQGVDPFNGSTTSDADLSQGIGNRYSWAGVTNNSVSLRQPTIEVGSATPAIPVLDLQTNEILYGDRITSYRWEVLAHEDGVDNLIGTLDGVSDGTLTWTQNVSVKGTGKATVVDLAKATNGMLKISDVELESVRLRPVCVIQGLPETPCGTFLVSAAEEDWDAEGRTYSLELLDRCTVPDQDLIEEAYSVAAGTIVLQAVRSILATAGEYIAIDETNTLAVSSGMVWDVGTSKLKIINDLLGVINYNSLTIDGYGNFQATPYILPANRDVNYELLGIPRELVDGEQSIYSTDWKRTKDSYSVPNKVVAVQAAGGSDTTALTGEWTNEDPTSPYSYQARGRWITSVLTDVDVPAGVDVVTYLNQTAQKSLVASSAVQATVDIEHLPIPVRVGDILRFANTGAGIDGPHTITKLELDTVSTGLMKTILQEVISL